MSFEKTPDPFIFKAGVSGPVAQLEARPEVVYLIESTNLQLPPEYKYVAGVISAGESDTRFILIDPTMSLKIGKGKQQSPALNFLHEAAHVLQRLMNPSQNKKDTDTPDSQYRNREERRVITEIETPAAKKLGEPTRTRHGGGGLELVPAKCPTCFVND